jgi:glycosyltransferase involved in cell wall biosynthesis
VRYIREKGVEVFFAAPWPGHFTWPAYIRGIREIAARSDGVVDIVHSHFQMGTIAALMLRLLGHARQAMRTAHVALEWGEGSTALVCRQVFTNWAFPALLDAEVGVSPQVTEQLRHHMGSRLFRRSPQFISNAVEPDSVRALAEASVPVPWSREDNLVIGSAGRLTRQKGYTYLLRALPTLLDRVPNARLVLIGEGELRNVLQDEAAALGVSKYILFVGATPNVPGYLRQLDVFVLPSLWEGLPTVILESMICGVPVVASDIPGVRELICHGETGWLVPPADPTALADALADALQDPAERARRARQALPRVADFTMGAVAARYAQIYRRIAGR